MIMPYADDLNFWKTSQSPADTWIDKTIELIESFGGVVNSHAFGSDRFGRAAYMINFRIDEEEFKLIWPVLLTRSNKPADIQAARRQAATMLYHDCKSKCLKAAIFGARTAFFEYLILPDGQSITQVTVNELMEAVIPRLLNSGEPGENHDYV